MKRYILVLALFAGLGLLWSCASDAEMRWKEGRWQLISQSGKTTVYLDSTMVFPELIAAYRLDSVVKTSDYTGHAARRYEIEDELGKGVCYEVEHTRSGLPDLVQRFYFYPGKTCFFTEIELVGDALLACGYMAPVKTTGTPAFLQEQGFTVVEYVRVTGETLPAAVAEFAEKIVTNDFPSDGLVLLMDEIAYGESLGRTAKFPRNAMAFKWEDEIAETVLEEVEWSASRTGLINPVAVFEPVELEGTTVSRASVHNVSIVEQLALGVGDHIQVYKANMIIPQIAENMTRSGTLPIPEECPVCHSATAIHEENGVKALFCENASCPAKKIKSFSHFVSRDAMNIDGMSEATIEKLMNQDMIHEPADLFRLDRYKDQIIAMDGFGEKSYEKMVQSATRAAHTTIIRFLYSLGIPNVGLSNAGLICRYCAYDFDRVLAVSEEELTQIDGVGAVIAKAVTDYFAVEANRQVVQHLLQYITLEKIADDNVSKDMEGITFVITGSVERFKNRKELKELIESHGGKVTGSVTSKTNYLINNDAMSNSTKNKKARELGIPILTEQAFIEQYHLS